MSSAFNVLGISVSNPARVRLYATAVSQTSDVTRPSTTAPAFEVTQGLICDVTVDTAPWSWVMTPVPTGANGDFPRMANIYCTVDNADMASEAFTISVQYVQLVA